MNQDTMALVEQVSQKLTPAAVHLTESYLRGIMFKGCIEIFLGLVFFVGLGLLGWVGRKAFKDEPSSANENCDTAVIWSCLVFTLVGVFFMYNGLLNAYAPVYTAVNTILQI